MALDAYGNYIPDQYAGQFGGQPMGMDPSMMQNQMPQGVTPGSIPLQNMNPQAMPQQQGQGQLPTQSTAPVAAPQRQSIAPMGMPGPSDMPSGPSPASLAQGLREGAFDKEGNPISIEDRISNKWNQKVGQWEKLGDTFGKISDKFGSLFGG